MEIVASSATPYLPGGSRDLSGWHPFPSSEDVIVLVSDAFFPF
jgi:hypothetical protein